MSKMIKMLMLAAAAICAFGNLFAKDTRPAILLDTKNIVDKTEGEKDPQIGDITAIAEELESVLTRMGFKVITNNGVAKSAADMVDLNAMTDGVDDGMNIQIPPYRVEGVVYQYKAESKNELKQFQDNVNKRFYETRIAKVVGCVELSLKFVNMRTGETKFSLERMKREVEDVRETNSQYGGGMESAGVSNKVEPLSKSKVMAKAVKEACEQVGRAIVCNLKPYRILECSDEGTIVLDATSATAKVGEELQVFSLGKQKKNRQGKNYRAETLVAVLRVDSVSDDSCNTSFVSIDKTDCSWDVIVRPVVKAEDRSSL